MSTAVTTHSTPQQQQRRRRRPNVLITGTPGTGKTTLAARIVERLNDTPYDDNNDDTNQNADDATDHNTTMRAKHVNVGEIIQTHQFYDGYDTELDTHILDEDRLMDYLDDIFVETLQKNNPEYNDDDDDDEHYSLSLIADYHICEIFPERYFDLVIVLRTDTERLYDRYLERNYHRRPPVSTTTTTTTPPETTTTTTPKITANIQCEIMNVIWERALDAYATEIVVPLPSNTVEDMESNANRVLQWIQLWIQQQQNGV